MNHRHLMTARLFTKSQSLAWYKNSHTSIGCFDPVGVFFRMTVTYVSFQICLPSGFVGAKRAKQIGFFAAVVFDVESEPFVVSELLQAGWTLGQVSRICKSIKFIKLLQSKYI